MRIVGGELMELELPLREPFLSGHGERHTRRVLLLRIEGEEGGVGWGECVALETPSYTPETTDTAWEILTRHLLPPLVGLECLGPEEILRGSSWVRGHPMARATVEMAGWDLQARELGISLRELLGSREGGIVVGLVLGIDPNLERLLSRVDRAVAEGFRQVKLKIRPGWDLEPLEALRSRHPGLSLGADANGGYSPAVDLPHLLRLDRLELVMLEQPFPPGALSAHAKLQEQLATPIALDESIGSEDEADTALALRAARLFNLKPGRVGGLAAARRIARAAEGSGVRVFCGGMQETGIGRGHALAFAALPQVTLPADLGPSRHYWERDLVDPEFELRGGRLHGGVGPGIGVEPDEARVRALVRRGVRFGRVDRPVFEP